MFALRWVCLPSVCRRWWRVWAVLICWLVVHKVHFDTKKRWSITENIAWKTVLSGCFCCLSCRLLFVVVLQRWGVWEWCVWLEFMEPHNTDCRHLSRQDNNVENQLVGSTELLFTLALVFWASVKVDLLIDKPWFEGIVVIFSWKFTSLSKHVHYRRPRMRNNYHFTVSLFVKYNFLQNTFKVYF